MVKLPVIKISATKLETFARCQRLYWFKHVAKLPEPPTKAQAFGTAFHSVLERYFGNQNLYPKGWDTKLTGVERDLIQRLFTDAIEVKKRPYGGRVESVISNKPGQRVEYPFEAEVLRGVDDELSDKYQAMPEVRLSGVIDLLQWDGVDDNKTTASMKWAKNETELRTNLQLLVYAKHYIQDLKTQDLLPPPRIRLRHNYFAKDTGKSDFVEVYVTPDEVEACWTRVKLQAVAIRALVLDSEPLDDEHAMTQLVKAKPVNPPEHALSGRGPCGDYGGCSFREICGGIRTVAEHRKIINSRLTGNGADSSIGSRSSFFSSSSSSNGEGMASIFETLRTASAPAVNGASQVPPAVAAPPVAPVVAAPTGKLHPNAAPWTNAECQACRLPEGSMGFASSGDPCQICRNMQAKIGGISPDMFKAGYSSMFGECSWEVLEQYLSVIQQQAPTKLHGRIPATFVKSKVQAATAPPTPVPVVAATVTAPVETVTVSAPVVVAAPTPAETKKAEKESKKAEKEQKKAKFVLCINCGPQDPGTSLVRLEQVFLKYSGELATAKGKASYYEIDAFQRRDLMTQCVEKIIEEEKFGTKYVLGTTGTPDLKAFTESFRPYAYDVVVGYQG